MNTTLDTPRIARLLQEGVRAQVYPGAAWAVGDARGPLADGAVGVLSPAPTPRPDSGPRLTPRLTPGPTPAPDLALTPAPGPGPAPAPAPAPGGQPTRPDTLFDLASLTKIIAVWPVVGTLVEAGKLELDAPLGSFWPEVTGHPLGDVTPLQLLTHTAGLPLRANLRALYGTDPQDVRDGVLREPLRRRPGEAVEYTDRAALILGYLAEHLTGLPLARLAAGRVWEPLGMTETRFGPLPEPLAARCAPTEYDEETGTHLRGTVHDFSTRLLGGSCGIAGVFSTTGDLGRFLRRVLDPVRPPFGPEWVAASLRARTGELAPVRGLFWHLAPGTALRDDIWVHYGFTGTGMWVSPSRGRWAVLLTNKLYLTRATGPVTAVRDAFREAVFAPL